MADPRFQAVWGSVRSVQLHRAYAARRDRYAAAAEARGLLWDDARIAAEVRARLRDRGYTPAVRRAGEVHTLVFLPSIGWHPILLNDLRALGRVSVFDYTAHGFAAEDFYPPSRRSPALREQMNELFLRQLREAHARDPVDWVFMYASGGEVSRGLVERVTAELGVPVVSMFLDDKHGWEGERSGTQRSGQVDIVREFDLSWTSARVACEWYMVEGARPIYMPEGFDAATYRPVPLQADMPVSFLGSAYGYRARIVAYLRAAGVDIRTFGAGWPDSGWVEDVSEVLCRSVINLGMGGIGYSASLTNLKARDFEIPGAGGGVYLTSYNADLSQHFVIGEEVLCYGSRDELVELIRHYLSRPDEAAAIARRGRERCVREHRWLHRYERICRMLGVLADATEEEGEGTP